ncbi:low molecular weight protein-tyrosine-phosphatase [Hydrogenophaga sp. XSHU_21]
MHRILLVCMGNICRSPLASAVLQAEVGRRGLQDRVVVDSAGTYGGRAGEPADGRAVRLALERGYGAIAHERARQVREDDFERFDVILAMDFYNRGQLYQRCPVELHHKVHLYLDYAGLGEREVPDPYAGPIEGFEQVLSMCEQASGALLDRLLAEAAQAR